MNKICLNQPLGLGWGWVGMGWGWHGFGVGVGVGMGLGLGWAWAIPPHLFVCLFIQSARIHRWTPIPALYLSATTTPHTVTRRGTSATPIPVTHARSPTRTDKPGRPRLPSNATQVKMAQLVKAQGSGLRFIGSEHIIIFRLMM